MIDGLAVRAAGRLLGLPPARLWRSRAEAEEAAQAVNSVPECATWFRHIAESGGLRHVEVVSAWAGNSPYDVSMS